MINLSDLRPELKFRTSRSSGSGGQHVNKVETRVELLFDVNASRVLTDNQKRLVLKNLNNRINKDGIFQISVQDSRSQATNRDKAERKFYQLIKKALLPPKKRKKVKPLVAEREKRLQKKKKRSEVKAMRKKIEW